MCKVESVVNHVNKAVQYTDRDSKRELYGKTVAKYEEKVVSSMVLLASAVSEVLGKKVTVLVEDEPCEPVKDKPSKRMVQQEKEIQYLKEKVNNLEQSLSTVVEQNNTTINMMASLSEYLCDKHSEKVPNVKSTEKKNVYVTKLKPGKVPITGNSKNARKKSSLDEKKVNAKDCVKSNKKLDSSKSKAFESSKVKKVFHKYYDDQADSFYRVLSNLSNSKYMSVEMISSAALPWFDCRFVSKKPPVSPSGKPAYRLYQFPRYLAYYVGVCAHRWNNYKLYNVASDFDEFVKNIQTSEHENPMPAPNFLIAKSTEHVELGDVDVVRGYSLWLTFVEWFNKMSKDFGEGVTLESGFFTAKMKALGYGSESLLAELQDLKDSSDIDYEQYKKTGTL